MIDISRMKAPGASQIAEIEELARDCDSADGTSTAIDFDTSLNYRRGLPAWYIAAEGPKGPPLGFLSIFAPEAETAEITVMVRPQARRRGIFAALLAAAEAELRALGYRELLFIRDAASASGGEALGALRTRRGARLDRREFSMVLRGASASPAPAPRGIMIERGVPADLGELTALNALAFGDSEDEARSFLEATFAVPQRTILVARRSAAPEVGLRAGAIVGMVSVFVEGPTASINGLLVAEAERRAGIGSFLLDRAIAHSDEGGASRIGLEVDALNRGALGLYARRGFEVVSEEEYWRAPLAGC